MNQYPNLSLTLILTFILLAPFTLKIRYHLEPYPAIILPAGAGKTAVGTREVSFNQTNIWGKNEKDKTWARVDVETFLAPIPVQYLHAITKNSLGFNSAEGRIIKLPKKIKFLSKKVTSSEVQDAKKWWSKKLAQSGYSPDELMITFEKVKFNIETGTIISIKRNNEEIIRLD